MLSVVSPTDSADELSGLLRFEEKDPILTVRNDFLRFELLFLVVRLTDGKNEHLNDRISVAPMVVVGIFTVMVI